MGKENLTKKTLEDKEDVKERNEKSDKYNKKAEELLKNKDKLEKALQKMEKKLETVPIVGTTLSYVPVMISLIRSYIKHEYDEVPVATVIAIVVALIYFLSPLDLLPDVIPGYGYVDDAGVIALCVYLVKTDIFDYKIWREEQGYVFKDLVDYEEVEKMAMTEGKKYSMFFKRKKEKD